jgi:hypothetical protein
MMGSCNVIQTISRRFRATVALCVVVICALIGCGGGTTGSGDAPSVKVYGTVADQQGRAVSSGKVTDLTGGGSATIDSTGSFILSAVPDDGTVSLDVTARGTSGSIQVKDLPSTARSVAVKVVVDSVSGIVTVASVEIDPTDPSGAEAQLVSQRIRGTITGSTGKPAKNVVVSIVGARGSTKTGSEGTFNLTAQSTTGTMTLRLTYKGLDGETVIRGIPKDRPCTLRVRLSISIEAGQNPGEGDDGGAILSVDVDGVSVS